MENKRKTVKMQSKLRLHDLGVKSFDQGNDGAALEWLSKVKI